LPPEITAAGTTILPRRFKLYHYQNFAWASLGSAGEESTIDSVGRYI
jgi:hypothetical protein